MRRLCSLILTATAGALVGVLILAARALPPSPPPSLGSAPADFRPPPGALERLAAAIRVPTVSRDYPATAPAFDALHELLREAFPRVHATLQQERVAGHTLLYTWHGRDASAPALLLLAHQDVVPVDDERLPHWQQPPFDGVNADGYLWGRGTLDDKSSLMAQLEAAEALLGDAFVPPQTIYLVFGHDEEVSGSGAAAVAALLAERGTRIGMVLDEGLTLTEGVFPGVNRPVALVGVAEKGYLNLTLRASAAGGHSSMPPQDTAIGRLAAALDAVRTHPMPARMETPVADMLRSVGGERSWLQRVALGNLWLFEPLVRSELARTPAGGAMLRTTVTPTILRAGLKDNVLPQSAEAVLNARLLPGDSSDAVVAHLHTAIDDPAIEILPATEVREATPVSETSGTAFRALSDRIVEVFPDALVAPGLMMGGTDARHFVTLSRHVYRFQPVRITLADLPRFHGDDERIAPAAYEDMIRFYAVLMRGAIGDGGAAAATPGTP
ncbi:MAG: M20/M25/M40 family metallo-hydrolase [Xanthomonadales bacterium]|nr:M20/M25/M40 family metallo-hydrolase [Xanthomonadales bacterium]